MSVSLSNFFKSARQFLNFIKSDKKSGRGKSFWNKLSVWVSIAFGVTLLLILINQVPLQKFLNVFSNVRISYLAAALIAGVSATVLKTFRYGSFFPAPGRWLKLYGVFALTRVIYYVLPFNSGEFIYLSFLKKYKFAPTITEVAPTWMYLRLTDVIALTLWFITTLLFSHLTGNLFEEMYHMRWIIIGVSILFVVVLFSLPNWIMRITFIKSNNLISKHLNLLKAGFERIYGLSLFIRTIFISLITWSLLIGWHIFAQLAFNTPLELWQCVFVSITIYFISLLPLNTPLNIGTDEAAWTGAMIMSGVTLVHALSIAFSIRIVYMLILMSDGLIGFSVLISHPDIE